MAYLLSYSEAGGTKYEVDFAFQFSSVDEFNEKIMMLGFGETFEDGETFYIKKVSEYVG